MSIGQSIFNIFILLCLRKSISEGVLENYQYDGNLCLWIVEVGYKINELGTTYIFKAEITCGIFIKISKIYSGVNISNII